MRWYQHHIDQQIEQANKLNSEIQIAQWKFQDKTEGYIRLNHALSEFIYTQETLRKQCKKSPPSLYEQVDKRFMPRDSLELEVQHGKGLVT